jgi:PIN domain-containing protein
VPADSSQLRSFVDESALGLGKTLAIARRDVVHCGHPLIPEVPVGTLDPDWIPAVASRGLAVIARDKRIRTKPAELALLRAHGMRVFWIAGRRDLSTWDALVRVVNRWDDIEVAMSQRGGGPWFFAILERELREIGV